MADKKTIPANRSDMALSRAFHEFFNTDPVRGARIAGVLGQQLEPELTVAIEAIADPEMDFAEKVASAAIGFDPGAPDDEET